ncbi:MAG: hypothetical protein KAR21_27345, partial [Spirochaetales bacterium]|nr:hypothetical protein [Spirochaetales bacterium]
ETVGNNFPSGSAVPEHKNPGAVRIPYFDSEGRSSLLTKYIHHYYSDSDYSVENLINYPTAIYNDDTLPGTDLVEDAGEDRIPESFEVFSGGAAGWFYGVWTGYYESFNKVLLRSLPPVNNPEEVKFPKYFTPMEQNIKDNNEPIETSVGKDQIFMLDNQSLVADLSSYTESDFDYEGEPLSVTHHFAPAIKGSELHADRNGGDTYFNVPRGSTPMDGGMIGF